METTLGLIVLTGAALAVIWRWVILPIGKAARAVVRVSEAHPVLMDIASEFKPNHGTSLKDTVDRIEANLQRHQHHADERFDTLENKIDMFILQRKPNGLRITD